MAELDAYVSVRGVSKHFFNRKVTNCVLEGIDVDVASGEFLTVIGPSGCGKSTLLNMIAGLVMPDEGTIVVDGKPVTAPGCDRGMVFQQHVLLPWMTAYENVRFGVDCALASRAADERHKLALHYLKVVHLLHAWESERKTVLMVTHDVDEAITLSDRILVMSHGPAARIRQEVVVPFARPRDKERLLRDPDYYELRASLLSVLTREVESDAVLTS